MRLPILLLTALAVAGCDAGRPTGNESTAQPTNAASPAADVKLTLTRLDCGSATIKDFDSFFSDRPGLYPKGPREITDSCYLITHDDLQMIWDTGLAADLKGKSEDKGDWVPRLNRTLAEQLGRLRLAPADIDVLGISHWHQDHTGQAAAFSQARLVIGNADFEQVKGKDDPFGPWRTDDSKVTLASGDIDIFGDGSVVALHLPGHTPDHFGLLVKLASGTVLLTGDLYHSTMAREKRGVPPFNTSREQTLASMDRFEKLAQETGAKVIIQHEPADIAKLPAFPQAAE